MTEDDSPVTAKIDRVSPFGERVLLVIDGAALQVLPLPGLGTLTIGRGNTCDVVIDSGSVSRQHAMLHIGDSIELEDIGSSNGTYIDGGRLNSGLRAQVEIGVPFMLGSVAVMVQTRDGSRVDSAMTPIPAAGPGPGPGHAQPPPIPRPTQQIMQRPTPLPRMRSSTIPPPQDSTIQPGDMPAQVRATIAELERQRILDALDRCAGNQTRAAELLGISRRTLINRLDEYGIARPRKRDE